MITSVELNDSGVAKFDEWFAMAAKANVSASATAMEVCNIMADRLASQETLVYELRGFYTQSGRPEMLYLEPSDLDVAEEDTEA